MKVINMRFTVPAYSILERVLPHGRSLDANLEEIRSVARRLVREALQRIREEEEGEEGTRDGYRTGHSGLVGLWEGHGQGRDGGLLSELCACCWVDLSEIQLTIRTQFHGRCYLMDVLRTSQEPILSYTHHCRSRFLTHRHLE